MEESGIDNGITTAIYNCPVLYNCIVPRVRVKFFTVYRILSLLTWNIEPHYFFLLSLLFFLGGGAGGGGIERVSGS